MSFLFLHPGHVCSRYAHPRSWAVSRLFSTSPSQLANRAIFYTERGDPTTVLRAMTYPSLPAPARGILNVRFRLSPINPADINVIEGVYPDKPASVGELSKHLGSRQPVFVGGNEGLAEIVRVGDGVEGLKEGDWVVMKKSQVGTWASERAVLAGDVIKLPGEGVSEVNGATISVNPPTAYNMLHDFVELTEGDWVLQNGANSAVGQMVIQIAAKRGLRTINFVRNRPNIDHLKQQLHTLGATHVYTYDDLVDKEFVAATRKAIDGKPIRLLLNSVGGRPTTQMTRLLGQDAHLVSYGAMSKQPLALPTSAFIFKNLTAHGFWQSRWYDNHSAEERATLMRTLIDLKLREPEHKIVTVENKMTDEEAAKTVTDVIARLNEGSYGKKLLLKIESPST